MPSVSTITSANYQQLGEVSNMPSLVINNGVIVTLNAGSCWTVTGTSYLSKLVIAPGATLTAPPGHTLALTIDGVPTPIVAGQSYSGNIVLAVH
jgi:protein-disulfide isomerase